MTTRIIRKDDGTGSKVVDGGAVQFSGSQDKKEKNLEGRVEESPVAKGKVPVLDTKRLMTAYGIFVEMQKYLGREKEYKDIQVSQLRPTIDKFIENKEGYEMINLALKTMMDDLEKSFESFNQIYNSELVEKNEETPLTVPKNITKTIYDKVANAIIDINDTVAKYENSDVKGTGWLATESSNITELLNGMNTGRKITDVMLLTQGLAQALGKIHEKFAPYAPSLSFSGNLVQISPWKYIYVVNELSKEIGKARVVNYSYHYNDNFQETSVSGFRDVSPPLPMPPKPPKVKGNKKSIWSYLGFK